MKIVALLSGGLDSLVSLAMAGTDAEIAMGLFFDYGQKSAARERQAAEAISAHYNIPFKMIKLDWLAAITNTALVSKKIEVPKVSEWELEKKLEITQHSAKAVWVPNRNAVFVNIAAAFAESIGADQILAGFNAEEAATFPDNSIQFINFSNQLLRLSTLSKPKVVSPIQTYNKNGIVNIGVKLKVPFNLVYSCYTPGADNKMCGECESCSRLKRAFKSTGNYDLIKDSFPEEDKDKK